MPLLIGSTGISNLESVLGKGPIRIAFVNRQAEGQRRWLRLASNLGRVVAAVRRKV